MVLLYVSSVAVRPQEVGQVNAVKLVSAVIGSHRTAQFISLHFSLRLALRLWRGRFCGVLRVGRLLFRVRRLLFQFFIFSQEESDLVEDLFLTDKC